MKYEVGQIIYAIDPCVIKGHKKPTLTVGKAYGISAVYNGGFSITNDWGNSHSFDEEEAVKYFTTEWFSIEPTDSGLKYTPEQIAYLDQCAIAAMGKVISSQYYRHIKTVGEISETAHDLAEAMLQERERRVKG